MDPAQAIVCDLEDALSSLRRVNTQMSAVLADADDVADVGELLFTSAGNSWVLLPRHHN